MTEIKSVYEWVVLLIRKKSLEPTSEDLSIIRCSGEENSELACIESITNLITTKNKNSEYLVARANYTYIGEEF